VFRTFVAVFILFSVAAFADVDTGTRMITRVLKLSPQKKVVILNRGREDGIQIEDHARMYAEETIVGTWKAVKLSAQRSVWEAVEVPDYQKVVQDEVYHLVISSPVVVVDDPDVKKSTADIKSELLEINAPVVNEFTSWRNWRLSALAGLGNRPRSGYLFGEEAPYDRFGVGRKIDFQVEASRAIPNEIFTSLRGTASFRVTHADIKYPLLDAREIQEREMRWGFGFGVQWDTFETDKFRLSWGTALQMYPFDRIRIDQTEANGRTDFLNFHTMSTGLSANVSAVFKDIFGSMDLGLRFYSELRPGKTMQTIDSPSYKDMWATDDLNHATVIDYSLLVEISERF
jgi:hypothetical protein